MDHQNVWATYFSPTGTTKKMVVHLANRLGQLLNSNVVQFDFTLPDVRKSVKTFCKSDIVVFGVPVYAGRVPNVLLKYLDTFEGAGAKAIPVVLFGNRSYGDALKELRNILEARDFHTVAAAAFVGEHSFSNTLAMGRPDAMDFIAADKFIEQVFLKLCSKVIISPIRLDDESPVRPYYQPRRENGAPIDLRKVTPKTRDTCIRCGLCAAVCPMGTIDPKDVTHIINICIKCGACVKSCPMGAKYFDDERYIYHKMDLEQRYSRRANPVVFV